MLYYKRDDFNLRVVNFSFICCKIRSVPAHGVYIYQLMRQSRVCSSYQYFIDREQLSLRKLLNQRSVVVKLKSSLNKFYDFVKLQNQRSVAQGLAVIFSLHQVCIKKKKGGQFFFLNSKRFGQLLIILNSGLYRLNIKVSFHWSKDLN